MQERRNSIANTLELRLSCTNPSISSATLATSLLLPPQVEFFLICPDPDDFARILLLEFIFKESNITLHVLSTVLEVSQCCLEYLDGTFCGYEGFRHAEIRIQVSITDRQPFKIINLTKFNSLIPESISYKEKKFLLQLGDWLYKNIVRWLWWKRKYKRTGKNTKRRQPQINPPYLSYLLSTYSLQNKIWNLLDWSTTLPKCICGKEGKLARPTQVLSVRVCGPALILKTVPTFHHQRATQPILSQCW